MNLSEWNQDSDWASHNLLNDAAGLPGRRSRDLPGRDHGTIGNATNWVSILTGETPYAHSYNGTMTVVGWLL